MSETVRSFVAVDISDNARQQVGVLLGGLRRERPADVRWAKPELMHLTLAFLGEVTTAFIESTRTQLSRVAAGARPFEARLGGLGAFPGPVRARVVWVGTKQGKDELCGFQQATVRALVRIGFKPEKRPFSPHLTLGRTRLPADVSSLIETEFESEPFTVDRVILFRSVLGPEGPVYTRLAEFPFGG